MSYMLADPTVIRDFSWTGAENVEKAMAENKKWDLGLEGSPGFGRIAELLPQQFLSDFSEPMRRCDTSS